jgi:hypothetical protein
MCLPALRSNSALFPAALCCAHIDRLARFLARCRLCSASSIPAYRLVKGVSGFESPEAHPCVLRQGLTPVFGAAAFAGTRLPRHRPYTPTRTQRLAACCTTRLCGAPDLDCAMSFELCRLGGGVLPVVCWPPSLCMTTCKQKAPPCCLSAKAGIAWSVHATSCTGFQVKVTHGRRHSNTERTVAGGRLQGHADL